MLCVIWAENFRFVDIEINAPVFINLEINLIFRLYPKKVYKFNQRVAYVESQTANEKPGNSNYCALFNERTLIG